MMHNNAEVLRMLDRATTVLVAEAKGGTPGKSAETLLIELSNGCQSLQDRVMAIAGGSPIPTNIDETFGKIHAEVAARCTALKKLKLSAQSLAELESTTYNVFVTKYLAKNEEKVTQPLKTKTAAVASTMLETLKSLHPSSKILKSIQDQEREVKKEQSCTIS